MEPGPNFCMRMSSFLQNVQNGAWPHLFPRYHGMAPLVSHLVKMGMVEPRAYPQEKVFQAAELFLKTEGILSAPESAHAIATVIEEALRAKKENKEKVILFNLSGHGFLDINAFDRNSNKQ